MHFQGHSLTLHVNRSRLSCCGLWVNSDPHNRNAPSRPRCILFDWLLSVCLPAQSQYDRPVMCRQTGCSSLLPAGTRTLTAFSVNASAFFQLAEDYKTVNVRTANTCSSLNLLIVDTCGFPPADAAIIYCNAD